MENTRFVLIPVAVCCLIFLAGCASSPEPQGVIIMAEQQGRSIRFEISANAPGAVFMTVNDKVVGRMPLDEKVMVDGYQASPPITKVLEGNIISGFAVNYYLEGKVTAPDYKTAYIKEYVGQYRERELPRYVIKEDINVNVDLEPLPGVYPPAATEPEPEQQTAGESVQEETVEPEQQEMVESAREEAAATEEQEAAEPEQQETAEPEIQEAVESAQEEAAEPGQQETMEPAGEETAETGEQTAAEPEMRETAGPEAVKEPGSGDCINDCRKMGSEGELRPGLTIDDCINRLCL